MRTDTDGVAEDGRRAAEADGLASWSVAATTGPLLDRESEIEVRFAVLEARYGEMLRRFLLAGRPGLGLLLTSGLFALAHELFADGPWTQTLSTTAVYAAMGLMFGAVYVRTGRLWAAILAHAGANALGMAMLAYSGA